MIQAPKFRLNNGTHIPVIGLGTRKLQDRECYEAVRYAIDIGYRHFDTGYVYQNEQEIGDAINSKIREEKIKREDIFICTKLACVHHEPKVVQLACRKSIRNLELKYIDLYLIEFPVGRKYRIDDEFATEYELSDVDYIKTWKAMEELVYEGFVRSIGVSNFNSQQIQRILQVCRIKPTVNQVECHLGFTQKKLINFCRKNFIDVVAHSPLSCPDLDRKLPVFLTVMAVKYSKTPAQLCLRFLLQIGVYPIPKSARTVRINENYNIFDFIISIEDMKLLSKYNNSRRRLVTFLGSKNHKYYPFNIRF